MPLQLRLASYLILAAAGLAVGWQVRGWKEDSTEAAITRAVAAVEARTAEQISGIRVVRQTINGRVREVVRESVVYRDCLVGDDMRRLLDAARAGRAEPAVGGGGLPTAGTSPSP